MAITVALLSTPHLEVVFKESGSHSTDVSGGAAHLPESGLLHRLDQGTSGCLAFARTQEAYDFYKAHWDQAVKVYRAIVIPAEGCSLPDLIDEPLVRSKKTSKRVFTLSQLPSQYQWKGEPQSARTLVLERKSFSPIPGALDLTIQIQTGFMHQIRVHLSSLGFPILGDLLYGKSNSGLEPGRLHLHAWRLSLPGFLKPSELLTAEAPLNWPLSMCTTSKNQIKF